MPLCEFPEEAFDLAKSFDCIQAIVRGGSTVYQAICTRGRLRGRTLALKKVSRSKAASSPGSTTFLHQTLHHPNIASLYSVLSAISSDYHVLEFCSEGNLSDILASRNPSVLSETELRRVLKGIGSALVYLKEERVIHRNVCSSTILFAENLKPKLSDFEHAVRLPQEENFVFGTYEYEMATYRPPEVLSRSAYDFAVDTWSLGCTAQLCVHSICDAGDAASEGNHNPHLQDLLTRLLEICHAHRMDASQILKHPFITDDLTLPIAQTSSKIPGASGILQSEKPEGITASILFEPPRADTHDRKTNNRARPMSTFAKHFNHLNRRILDDITNKDLGRPSFCSRPLPGRRVVSDPVSFQPPYGIAREKPTNSDSTLNTDASLIKHSTEVLPATYNIVLPFQNSISHDERPMKPLEFGKGLNKIHGTLPPLLEKNPPSLPIGTTRPQPINTLLLERKTHKVVNGSLTILASHSLLVDFRENQRRRGLRGDEVLLIDPTGTSVKVFGAPHLSVPTCLIEPTNEYTIDTLPPSYWKIYNDAHDLVTQVKQRTPHFIMNTNEAKCTLMANAPMGDIEILLNLDSLSYNGSTSVGLKIKDNLPSMRIRFSRQQCFLEFAQHIVEARGSEWKKRVKPFTGDFGLLLEDDFSDLERKALHILTDFLQTCQKIEQLSALDITSKALDSADEGSVDNCGSVRTWTVAPLVSSTSLKVHKDGTNSTSSGYRSDRETHIAKDALSQRSASAAFETRFIHSTGWCIKYPSEGYSKAVYNILFLDGTVILTDGVQVEFMTQSDSGNVLRCRVSESDSYEEVGQRMKCFNDFVRLFDSS